jgi:hypothetical protein
VHVWERVLFVVAHGFALAGCDKVYGLGGRTDPPSDTSIDAASDEVGFDCAGYELELDETFSDPTPCSPWGTTFENAQHRIYTQGGALFIEADSSGAAGCTRIQPLEFPRAVLAEVSSVIDVERGYTFVSAGSEDTLKASGGELRYESDDGISNYGKIQWAPGARYWRLEQRGEFRIGSYSLDGTRWNELGRRRVPPANVILGIIAGLGNTPSPDTGHTQIERLVVCR